MKRLIALGLAVVMLVSALTACAPQTSDQPSQTSAGTKAPETNAPGATDAPSEAETEAGITFPLAETLKVSVLSISGDESNPLANDPVMQHLLERGNIEFEWTEIYTSEASEKANMLLNSGDYPDICFKTSGISSNGFGADGVFIPLEDMIREYMPNLTALLDERNGWSSITAPDGHIYSLPCIVRSTWAGRSNGNIWINTAWMDKLGYDMPTSMEELYEILKAFKEKDPNSNGVADEIPMCPRGMTGEYGLACLLVFLSDLSYYGAGTSYCAVNKEGEFVAYPLDESYREYMEWMVKLYQEGLLHNEFNVISGDQLKATGKSGDVLGMVFSNRVNAYVSEEGQTYYEALENIDQSMCGLGTGISADGLMITDKCENPEIICAWADYLYSVEGAMIYLYGIEGVDYQYNEAAGYYEYLTEGETVNNRNMAGTAPCYAAVVNEMEHEFKANTVGDERANENYSPDGVFGSGIYLPELVLTEEESDTISVISTDCSAYIKSFLGDLMKGEKTLDDASWEEFKNTLKQMGIDQYVEIYKAHYDEVVAN